MHDDLAANLPTATLVAAGNTYNPSLIVLRAKGYELWLEPRDDGSLWLARKDQQTFLAFSAPELLGLVVLWETLGAEWNQQEPSIYEELLDKMYSDPECCGECPE